jgi:uncharacterized membrane protein
MRSDATVRTRRSNWLIPAGLLALSAVPALAGSLRLLEFAGAAPVLPDSERISSAAVPVTVHIVSVTVFSMLGAFQFAPGLRRRRPGWHRAAGRVVVPAGVIAALSGLWLTLFLPPAAVDGTVLAAIRVVVATVMTGALVLGFVAIRQRDFARHRAWMIRGYALGMGAGTQFFTQAAWLIAVGPFTVSSRTGTMAAAWLINVVVAEWVIRRRPAVPARRPARIASVSPAGVIPATESGRG